MFASSATGLGTDRISADRSSLVFFRVKPFPGFHPHSLPCPRSSGGQSSGFLNHWPGVRVTPGAPYSIPQKTPPDEFATIDCCIGNSSNRVICSESFPTSREILSDSLSFRPKVFRPDFFLEKRDFSGNSAGFNPVS